MKHVAFGILSLAAAFSFGFVVPPVRGADAKAASPLVPSKARWEQQMLKFGEVHLKQLELALADPKADPIIGANFYDRVRLLYDLADYTHDEKWAAAADKLAVA